MLNEKPLRFFTMNERNFPLIWFQLFYQMPDPGVVYEYRLPALPGDKSSKPHLHLSSNSPNPVAPPKFNSAGGGGGAAASSGGGVGRSPIRTGPLLQPPSKDLSTLSFDLVTHRSF